MKKKSTKENNVKVGFRPIVGTTRYTIKNGKKIKSLDVIKPKQTNKE